AGLEFRSGTDVGSEREIDRLAPCHRRVDRVQCRSDELPVAEAGRIGLADDDRIVGGNHVVASAAVHHVVDIVDVGCILVGQQTGENGDPQGGVHFVQLVVAAHNVVAADQVAVPAAAQDYVVSLLAQNRVVSAVPEDHVIVAGVGCRGVDREEVVVHEEGVGGGQRRGHN